MLFHIANSYLDSIDYNSTGLQRISPLSLYFLSENYKDEGYLLKAKTYDIIIKETTSLLNDILWNRFTIIFHFHHKARVHKIAGKEQRSFG